jgi:RimJ/RimL family protein N-acetyltransferase
MNAPAPKLDEWIWTTAARDGTPVTIRPLRRGDEQREIAFIEWLSERTRYFRMFTPLKFLSPQMLGQFMDVDYDRRMALVATIGSGDDEKFVGVARYAATDRPDRAELGVTVTDDWQRRGVATILIRALMRFAQGHGFRELTGVVLPENHAMLELARSLGFKITLDAVAHVMRISRDLALGGIT